MIILWTALLLLIVASGAIGVWVLAQLTLGYSLLPRSPRAEGVWSPVAAGLGLVWVALQVGGRLASGLADEPLVITIDQVRGICIDNLVVVAVLLLALRFTRGTHPSDFGLTFLPSLQEMKYWLGGFVASLAPTYAILVLMLGFRSAETEHPLLKLLGEDATGATVAWIILAAVVTAPLAEELLFRVVLQRAAGRFMSPTAAIVSVAVLFSAVHGWPDSLALVPLALILGYVYDRRNSYLDVVALHALFNGLNLALKLFADNAAASAMLAS